MTKMIGIAAVGAAVSLMFANTALAEKVNDPLERVFSKIDSARSNLSDARESGEKIQRYISEGKSERAWDVMANGHGLIEGKYVTSIAKALKKASSDLKDASTAIQAAANSGISETDLAVMKDQYRQTLASFMGLYDVKKNIENSVGSSGLMFGAKFAYKMLLKEDDTSHLMYTQGLLSEVEPRPAVVFDAAKIDGTNADLYARAHGAREAIEKALSGDPLSVSRNIYNSRLTNGWGDKRSGPHRLAEAAKDLRSAASQLNAFEGTLAELQYRRDVPADNQNLLALKTQAQELGERIATLRLEAKRVLTLYPPDVTSSMSASRYAEAAELLNDDVLQAYAKLYTPEALENEAVAGERLRAIFEEAQKNPEYAPSTENQVGTASGIKRIPSPDDQPGTASGIKRIP